MAIGQFYFAHAGPGEVFDPDVHNVMDEEIVSFSFVHSEGDFAQVDFEIRNPRVGLLNTGRQQWCFFSFETSSGIVPIFYGRILGIPSNFFAEVVTITYTARPVDYSVQKIALANALKVAPFWDLIFIHPDKMDDPDTVLESRPDLWYIDPVTLVVSTSNVIVGEDGTVEKLEDEFFAEGMDLTLNQSPATTIRVKGSVSWKQSMVSSGSGLDMMPFISRRFIESFTLKGLMSSWPKPGSNVRGGYEVQAGELIDVSLTHVPQMEPPHWLFLLGDNLPAPLPVGSIFFQPKVTGKWWSGETAGFDITTEQVFAPKGYGLGTLKLSYDLERDFTENITILLKTSTQPIITDPGDDDIIEISINGNAVSDFIGEEVPIGDTRRRRFFATERGKDAIKYLVCCARAAAIIKSRAVEIVFEVPLEEGLEYSLRKNSLIHHSRLPGGQATGKVIRIEHRLNGDDGEAISKIVMGCCVGNGGVPYVESAGTPRYGSTAYMGADYQQFNSVVTLIDPTVTDLAFTVDVYEPDDDGLDPLSLTARDVVNSVTVQNLADDQLEQITPLIPQIVDTAQVTSILQEYFTLYSLSLKNLNAGPFETDLTITVQDLILPRQIDLEAPYA